MCALQNTPIMHLGLQIFALFARVLETKYEWLVNLFDLFVNVFDGGKDGVN